VNANRYPPIPALPVVFEDDALLVVNKPSGMLSQPGKSMDGSVLTRVLGSGRALHGPVLVHRLDMDTSGLLLLAKTREVHRALQQQFERRQVRKRYQARLELPVIALGGRIHLPIRLDVDDRPRQIVCFEHGKASTTLWHKSGSADPCAVTFYPLTGRTHQLRVHAASMEGLGSAIACDRLYGNEDQSEKTLTEDICVREKRLMLHADFLQFEHPVLHRPQSVYCPANFQSVSCPANFQIDPSITPEHT